MRSSLVWNMAKQIKSNDLVTESFRIIRQRNLFNANFAISFKNTHAKPPYESKRRSVTTNQSNITVSDVFQRNKFYFSAVNWKKTIFRRCKTVNQVVSYPRRLKVWQVVHTLCTQPPTWSSSFLTKTHRQSSLKFGQLYSYRYYSALRGFGKKTYTIIKLEFTQNGWSTGEYQTSAICTDWVLQA